MRSFIFFAGFGVVAILTLFNCLGIFYQLIGTQFPLPALLWFSNPIPVIFMSVIPNYLSIAVGIGMAYLISRRVRLIIISKKNRIPTSFSGILYVLVSILVTSLCAGILSYLFFIFFIPNTLNPFGLLLMPAILLLSPSIALIELLSFRASKIPPTHHSSGTPNGAP